MVSSLGTLSGYSVYSGQSNSVYGTTQVSDVENKQKSSDAQSSLPQEDIQDEAIISDEAIKLLANDKASEEDKLPAENKTETKDNKNKTTDKLPAEKKTEDKASEKTENKSDKKASKTDGDLTQEEQQEVSQLKARDTEVRAHEQAHIAAAGGLRTSAPSYTYQTGPDGKKYAIGGEVNVSFEKSGDPQEDIQNAETMRAAALAPADPSSQDRSVAANAEKIIAQARQELAAQQAQQKEQITSSETAKTLVGAGGVA